MNNITLHLDRKTQIITLLRGGHGKDTILELDDSDNAELTEEIFKAKDMTAIDQYEYEIAEVLSEEQRTTLYRSWGKALSIMISRTANVVGISKGLAKEIIIQGERYGILYQGNNNTWKISDPTLIRSRWVDKAKDTQKELKPEKDMTVKGILNRYAEKAKELNIKGFERKEGHDSGSGSSSGSNSEDTILKEETVEVIPEIPLEKVSKVDIQAMKQDLKDLEELKEQMKSGIVAETIKCNEHMLNDKIKTLKVQIANAEITQLQGQYTQGVKITASGSITKVERVEQRGVQKKESDMPHVSQKKIPTKGKPSSRSPVVKKK